MITVEKDKAKVSVCMITYNHEKYIEQAINSVFSQITNFPVELVIGEDSSTDSTADIIRKYEGGGKCAVRARYNNPNIGMQANFLRTLSECNGDYIALLEGDDYWTDPKKLQRQVDFLDANPEFAICFHPVDVLEHGVIVPDSRTFDVPDVTTIKHLADGNYMHTCSVVFRAKLFDTFPESFLQSSVGDYFLHMLNARYGYIKKLSQIMGVYRVHEGGVWSLQHNIEIKILSYLEAMIGGFDQEINDILIKRHQRIAFKSFISGVEGSDVADRLNRCLKYGPDNFCSLILPLIRWSKTTDKNFLLRRIRKLYL